MRYFLPFAVCVAALASAADVTPSCGLVSGWKQQGPARSYTADNLFEYMDGNAEGYLLYKFVKMNGVTCQSGENSIIFDVSEFANPEFAYGMYTANRDPNFPTEKIGMAGQVSPRRAIFVKDKYYIELAANPAKDHSSVLRSFVAAFEKQVPGRTEIPDQIGWFPKQGLQADTVRLVPESVLGIRALKRGYAAQYDFGKAFIVEEASPEAASAVMDKVKSRIGQTEPAKIGDDAFQANDRYLGRLAIFRRGKYVAGFANIKEPQDPVKLATELSTRIP